MQVTPANATVIQGEIAYYEVPLTSILGFTDLVDLTVTAEPTLDADVFIDPSPATPGSTALLTVNTSITTTPGDYTLTVTGTSGDLQKTRVVSLRVWPKGTVSVPYSSTDTPISIPDADAKGASSVIHVPQHMALQEVAVDLNVTHTWIGDLIVSLTSPNGTLIVLHDRAGGSEDNIQTTYSLNDFNGEDTAGDWILHISDNVGTDIGTLDDWTLRTVGVPGSSSFSIGASPDSHEAS